jgi:hypothetical protein
VSVLEQIATASTSPAPSSSSTLSAAGTPSRSATSRATGSCAS